MAGPQPTSAALSDGEAVLHFAHGEGLFLNDTMGCEVHRGVDAAGAMIGGECCKAKDTFQLCTGELARVAPFAFALFRTRITAYC